MSLQGTLRTLGITEVLEFLAARDATGRLDITADSGQATFWVLDGAVAGVDYEFEREAGHDAAEATFYALAELDGTFLFDEQEAPGEDAETEPVSEVLSRTADVADAWSDIEEVIPSPEHVLSRTRTFDEPVTVQPEWWGAIDAIGVAASSRQLAKSLGMRSLEASTMAAEMHRAGLLQVTDPPTEPTGIEPTTAEIATAQSVVQPATADHATEAPSDQLVESPESSQTFQVDEVPFHSTDAPAVEHEPNHPAGESIDPVAETIGQEIGEGQYLDQEGQAQVIPDISAILAPYEGLDGSDAYVDDDGSVEPAIQDAVAAAEELEAAVQELAAMADEGDHYLAGQYGTDTYDSAPEGEWPIADQQLDPSPAIDWEDQEDSEPDRRQEVFDTLAPSLDDDGWASDHSQHLGAHYAPLDDGPATEATASIPDAPDGLQPWGAQPQVGISDSPQSNPALAEPEPPGAAASLFGSSPVAEGQAFDPSYLPAPDSTLPIEPTSDEPADDGSFGTGDRSSVLKFLRRD